MSDKKAEDGLQNMDKESSKDDEGMGYLWRNPTRSYLRVTFTGLELKKFLMEQRVNVELFFFVIAGLPYSGKTTLVESIFNLPRTSHEQLPALNLHEAIIHRQKMFGESLWLERSKFYTQVSSILVAFTHYFAREHKLPSPEQEMALDLDGLFDDPEIQGYFKTICNVLIEPVLSIDRENKIERILHSSLSLVNVFDVGVNKAVYEFSKAIGGRNKHLLLVNVIDLVRSDSTTMMKPLELTDSSKYPRKYGDSQISIFKDRSTLQHFVSNMEAASLSKPQATDNTLIVGTHTDQFRTQSEQAEREKEIRDLLSGYADKMGYNCETYLPKMVTVNATDKEDCRKVQDALCKLIDNNKDFIIDLPVRYIFLRYVLSCTKKVYMSREKLVKYAKKCGFKDDIEVEHFLKIYRDCASIFSSSDKEHFLHSFVILLPIKFMYDLDKLYCMQDNAAIPTELKEPARCGILSECVFKALWDSPDDCPMSKWDFIVSVLKSVQLLIELQHGKYFCPSLRLEQSDGLPHSSSLIILSSAAYTSFSKLQCAFVKYLTNHFKVSEDCRYYNCVEFLSIEEGRISVRFFHDFIEVFVDPSNISPSHASHLYSILKTNSVAIMNEISNESSYDFCASCPRSSLKPCEPHFVKFDVLNDSQENLLCTVCKREVTQLEGIHWVKAAYQGSTRAAVPAKYVINPSNLLSICKDQLSLLTIQQIKTLSEKLMVPVQFTAMKNTPVDEVLFRVLYSWHCKNPTATMRKLALVLKEIGLYKEALILDKNLPASEQDTTFSSEEITSIASSWSDNWEPEVLATVLGVQPIREEDPEATGPEKCSSILQKWLDQNEGDRREKLAMKFDLEEYPSMATVVRTLLLHQL